MLQIRNPWGERAERTWNGDWGKNSPLWTYELKRELGVVNASGINMHDDMSDTHRAVRAEPYIVDVSVVLG